MDAEPGDHDKERNPERPEIQRQECEEPPIQQALVVPRDVRADDSQRGHSTERIDRLESNRGLAFRRQWCGVGLSCHPLILRE